MSKTIAVFGATGNQGGSVLRSLVERDCYHLKAVTRNINSQKAKDFSHLKNVTLAEADLDNKESVDIVLKGCYGAFLVTDFTSHFVKNREVEQGVNFIDKAIANNVKHIVFSGLENIESQIHEPCLHFDYKAAIEDYGIKQKDKIHFTSVRMPMYYQEVVGSVFNKAFGNRFLLNIPMDKEKIVYLMNVDDIGNCVASVFDHPELYKSQIIELCGDYMKVQDLVILLNQELSPLKVYFPGGSFNRFLFKYILKFPGVNDIRVMFDYFNYFNHQIKRDSDITKKLNPDVVNFSTWLKKNRTQIISNKTA
ncbi:nmrA-like family domain-containing protein 1 isoform X2 [Hydra vulgaris]|uniref:nmrA-like family domain-containing protein 1 isoform X2 n=1 Tax=Hydra vulgaris TaxID=6087 RepID=UPI0006413003|nr:nmrA-like family domain-containing protein 1 [Hydra vulgaris]XP_047136252.1 nmrA-like family domain-containing protein 1 [Hydra vulgaris]XP_047136253.1 nmrA-like family domain-containing protein 1 [Hydra vulgaris]XP_047136254.1 nmrA-like family domain-containing protein 1 [Hydra vulgaris]XP_047136255.1 nmrA-like family domain-containing protein 1 [Hydra vulgaris]